MQLNIKKTDHLDFVDSLRAIAALYVVCFHTNAHVNAQPHTIPYYIFTLPFKYGHFAVNLFIVISGFCLMIPVAKRDGIMNGSYKQFLIKRCIRILPPYYIALFISMALIFTILGDPTTTSWRLSLPVTWKGVITHLLLIQHLFYDTNNKINYVLWSVSLEWIIYFFFPLLVLLFRKHGSLKVTVSVIAIAILLMNCLTGTVINTEHSGICLHYFGLFCFGMIAAQITFSENFKTRFQSFFTDFRILIFILLFFLLAIICQNLKFLRGLGFMYADILSGISIALLICGLANGKLLTLRRMLSVKALSSLGLFSYSLYLIHAPMLQLLSIYIAQPFGLSVSNTGILFFFLGVPCILAVSYIFYLIGKARNIVVKKVSDQNYDITRLILRLNKL